MSHAIQGPAKWIIMGKNSHLEKSLKVSHRLNIVLPYDPSIISQEVYPTGLKTMSKQKTHMWIFIPTLFIITITSSNQDAFQKR